MPPDYQSFLTKVIIGLGIGLVLFVIGLVALQNDFNDHCFELGNISEVSGIYKSLPIPMLIADSETLPEGISNDIMLIGFGKFGADNIMRDIQDKHGILEGKKIKLAGTLIYGDGHTLLELTKKSNAFIEVLDPNSHVVEDKWHTVKILRGEILDPKCYFGVMKPGQGKSHKSCATRCISGGIPPVVRHVNARGTKKYTYYVLLGESGERVNKDILPLVAEDVQVAGNTRTIGDWNFIYALPSNVKKIQL